MRKNCLLVLLCCVCAMAISCSDDDAVADDASSPGVSANLKYGVCNYYGGHYTDGALVEYYLVLSDSELGNLYQNSGKYYIIDLISATEPTSETITIPVGTYTVAGADGNGVIYKDDSYYGVYGSDAFTTFVNFTSGSVTVSVSGSTTTVEGTLTDEDGTVHNISYSGEIDVRESANYSTISSNVEADLDDASCYAYYSGDMLDNNTAAWIVQVESTPGEGFYLVLLASSSADYDSGLPTGTFTGAYTGEKGTYLSAAQYGVYDNYSWYYNLDEDGNLTNVFAPLGTGEIEITENSNGTYTIGIDTYNLEETCTIKASWTGEPEVYDATSNTGIPKPPNPPLL